MHMSLHTSLNAPIIKIHHQVCHERMSLNLDMSLTYVIDAYQKVYLMTYLMTQLYVIQGYMSLNHALMTYRGVQHDISYVMHVCHAEKRVYRCCLGLLVVGLGLLVLDRLFVLQLGCSLSQLLFQIASYYLLYRANTWSTVMIGQAWRFSSRSSRLTTRGCYWRQRPCGSSCRSWFVAWVVLCVGRFVLLQFVLSFMI